MKRLLALVLGALLCAACSSGGSTESNWEQLDDISYLMPSRLPSNWALAYATERPGVPFDKWKQHTEIYANEARDEFVVFGAVNSRTENSELPSEPSTSTGFDPSNTIVMINGGYERDGKPTKTMDSHWRTGDLDFFVLHVAFQPDATLVRRLAREFKAETAFDYAPPAAPDGFHFIGSSGHQVTDYAMVFTPKSLAGKSRSDATEIKDDDPSVGINVGARYYAQRRGLTDLDHAKVERDGDQLDVEFIHDGLRVRVGSDAVDRDELLAIAESLKSMSYDDWQEQWGKRLLTQEAPER